MTRLEDLMSGFRTMNSRFGAGGGSPITPQMGTGGPGAARAMMTLGQGGGAPGMMPGMQSAGGFRGGQYSAAAPPQAAPAAPQITIEDLYRMLAGGAAPQGAQTMSLGQRMPTGGLGQGFGGLRPGGY